MAKSSSVKFHQPQITDGSEGGRTPRASPTGACDCDPTRLRLPALLCFADLLGDLGFGFGFGLPCAFQFCRWRNSHVSDRTTIEESRFGMFPGR